MSKGPGLRLGSAGERPSGDDGICGGLDAIMGLEAGKTEEDLSTGSALDENSGCRRGMLKAMVEFCGRGCWTRGNEAGEEEEDEEGNSKDDPGG